MLTRERLSLLLAMIVVVGLLVFLFVTLPASSTSALAAPPITKVLLRRHDRRKGPPDAKEIAALRKQVQKDQERKLKTREFKDMPLSVSEVRNLQSDTWYTDLQIQVKNISNKPIYSIVIYLNFPDIKVSQGVSGITMDYGLEKYVDISALADPADVHLNPGDKFVFTIPEQFEKGLRFKQEHSPEKMRKFELHFGVISFGDGTGFDADLPTDYRGQRPQNQSKKTHHISRIDNSLLTRSPPQDGCGSCGRYVIKPAREILCWDNVHDRGCLGHVATTSNSDTVQPNHATWI